MWYTGIRSSDWFRHEPGRALRRAKQTFGALGTPEMPKQRAKRARWLRFLRNWRRCTRRSPVLVGQYTQRAKGPQRRTDRGTLGS